MKAARNSPAYKNRLKKPLDAILASNLLPAWLRESGVDLTKDIDQIVLAAGRSCYPDKEGPSGPLFVLHGRFDAARIRAALGKAEKKAKRFRFVGKSGPNRIAAMVEFMMTAERAKIEKIDAALAPLKRAIEILRDYEFEPEKLEEALYAGDPDLSSPTRPRNAAADRGPSIPESL